MPDYQTRIQTLTFGGMDFRIRSLLDRQQYADPDGHAERAGIPPAHWSLFGQIWPAGRLLAEAMASHAGDGKRIRELGCGLGLASLVLQRRGADIVASDVHPLAETFLAYNAALNGLPALAYRTLRWDAPGNGLGRFDLIIASDVLYERGHASLAGGTGVPAGHLAGRGAAGRPRPRQQQRLQSRPARAGLRGGRAAPPLGRERRPAVPWQGDPLPAWRG